MSFSSSFRILQILSSICLIWAGDYKFETRFFDAKLDHFNNVNNQTFQLKYLINDTFWDREAGAPIFFYCGNEDAVETFADNLGFLWESAEKFKALILLVEHRYYGSSLPFGPESLATPKTSGYLSVEQTLADFIDVIDFIQEGSRVLSTAQALMQKEKSKLSEELQAQSENSNSGLVGNSEDKPEEETPLKAEVVPKIHPVIAFGGSYGGMLAFWLRSKYPHMVQGALASSAPMFQLNDMAPCDLYYKAVTKIYHDVSPGCQQNIRNLWSQINTNLQTDIGRVEFSKQWNLCKLIKSQWDVANFKKWLETMFTTMAMTNYPYPSDFMAPLPANPVKGFCDAFLSGLSVEPSTNNSSDLLTALHAATNVFTSPEVTGVSDQCLNIDKLTPLRNALPSWHYQTCTELMMPFCASEDTMYEPYAWDYEAWDRACRAKFGVGPDPSRIRKLFGERRIEFTSNVIFSNGEKDPWSAGGVHTNLSSSIISITIPDAAHHLDLRGSNPLDPASVVAVRKRYEEIFQKWIEGFNADLKIEASFTQY